MMKMKAFFQFVGVLGLFTAVGTVQAAVSDSAGCYVLSAATPMETNFCIEPRPDAKNPALTRYHLVFEDIEAKADTPLSACMATTSAMEISNATKTSYRFDFDFTSVGLDTGSVQLDLSSTVLGSRAGVLTQRGLGDKHENKGPFKELDPAKAAALKAKVAAASKADFDKICMQIQ